MLAWHSKIVVWKSSTSIVYAIYHKPLAFSSWNLVWRLIQQARVSSLKVYDLDLKVKVTARSRSNLLGYGNIFALWRHFRFELGQTCEQQYRALKVGISDFGHLVQIIRLQFYGRQFFTVPFIWDIIVLLNERLAPTFSRKATNQGGAWEHVVTAA